MEGHPMYHDGFDSAVPTDFDSGNVLLYMGNGTGSTAERLSTISSLWEPGSNAILNFLDWDSLINCSALPNVVDDPYSKAVERMRRRRENLYLRLVTVNGEFA
jgi:hypothetical protein